MLNERLIHPKQSSEDFLSLDLQIKEARKRAEDFSKTLQNARKEVRTSFFFFDFSFFSFFLILCLFSLNFNRKMNH